MSADQGAATTVTTPPHYGVNTTLRIRQHQPPEPFTGAYGPNPRPAVDWSRWEHQDAWEIDRVEFALANPPLETSPPGQRERTLTITGVRTLRDRGGAHVVTCSLDADHLDVEYIAKIYDGTDYPLGGRRPSSLDCMSLADRDYSIEAWAYRIMQSAGLGGTVVPRYYGSWTFAVDTHIAGRHRWVRMILMELVRGECMLDMIVRAEDKRGRRVDYALLPGEEFRLRVLQNILESQQAIWWEAAINHEDVEPRNVMVKPDGSVVIVDFNQAYIYEFTIRHDTHPKKKDPNRLPPSPIQRYWPLPCGFADTVEEDGPWGHWVPERWLRNPELAAEWLVQTYRNSPRFEPPSQRWLDLAEHAMQSERVLRLLESLGRKPAATRDTKESDKG